MRQLGEAAVIWHFILWLVVFMFMVFLIVGIVVFFIDRSGRLARQDERARNDEVNHRFEDIDDKFNQILEAINAIKEPKHIDDALRTQGVDPDRPLKE